MQLQFTELFDEIRDTRYEIPRWIRIHVPLQDGLLDRGKQSSAFRHEDLFTIHDFSDTTFTTPFPLLTPAPLLTPSPLLTITF